MNLISLPIMAGILFPYSMCIESPASPSIAICPETYSHDYRIKCDLDFKNESIVEILAKIEEKYGLNCGTYVDTMDVQITLKEDDALLKRLKELANKYDIHVQMDSIGDSDQGCLGIVGSQEAISATLSELKTFYTFKKVTKGDGIRIDFLAKQMPAWEVFGRLAQKSGLGIDYLSSRSMRLGRNGQTVLSFGTFGPFYIYLSKEMVSGKMVIDFLHFPSDMTNRDDVRIDNIDVFKGSEQIPVKGQNITAQSSNQPLDSFKWESNSAVEFNEGVLKGTVSAWVLTGTYCVKNLRLDSQLKNFGLNIGAVKADIINQSWFPDGIMSAPDKLKGDWISLFAQAEIQLPKEQLEFVQQTYQNMLKGKQPKRADLKRYFQIGKQLPLVMIDLENRYRVWYQHGFESRAWLDSIQNGNDVFPMDFTVRTYRYQSIPFSLTVQTKELPKTQSELSPIESRKK
jgi:hypothetical protein